MRLLLADDHTLFREMLREILSRKGRAYTVVGEATNGAETLELVTRHQPDLLLLDYKMDSLGRLSAFCKEVARRSPATRILILSGYAEEEIALEAAVGGAQGYFLKGAPFADLLRAVATLQAGGVWVDPQLPSRVLHTFLRQSSKGTGKLEKLSRQELKVLSLVAQQMSNTEIGAHLQISRKTVKNHLSHIFAKLGVAHRQEAAQHLLEDKKVGPKPTKTTRQKNGTG